jgi:hypothetical protein
VPSLQSLRRGGCLTSRTAPALVSFTNPSFDKFQHCSSYTYSGPADSAEFIHEDTTACTFPWGCHLPPLADDDPVIFSNAYVNGSNANLNSSEAVNMVQGGTTLESTSVPNPAGNSFVTTFGANSGPAPNSPPFATSASGTASGTILNYEYPYSQSQPWDEIDAGEHQNNRSANAPSPVNQMAAGNGSAYVLGGPEVISGTSYWELSEWVPGACNFTAPCGGWIPIQLLGSDNIQSIVAGAGSVDEVQTNGSVWRYNGECFNGGFATAVCTSWNRVDANAHPKTIAIGDNSLLELHTNNGSIWRLVQGGTWAEIDNNPKAVAVTANSANVYELHNDGSIYQWDNKDCTAGDCKGWILLDDNPLTSAISAGGSSLFELHEDGSIWHYAGTPCLGTLCRGWTEIDNNPAESGMMASGSTVYEQHTNGNVYYWDGGACSGGACRSWTDIRPSSSFALDYPLRLAVSNDS